jgi:3-hydroxyisobutyrate dehydrogenase-like beta-hydroxyacid dehydrogenase
MAAVSFFGLGAMGFDMAGRLAEVGHAVAIHDPADARRAEWARRFQAASHALDAASFVITCVTDDAALQALALGEGGLITRLARGACLIDHTTAAPKTARVIAAAAAARGAVALDAPVSGDPGSLSVMVGGDADALTRARPLLAAYARHVEHLGGAGAGQLAKLANQIAIAGIGRGLAEAVALACAGGIDAAALLRVLGHGSARSVQLERLATRGLAADWRFEHTFGFLAKDLQLALAAAAPLDARLPLTELVDRLLTP